MNFQLRSVSTLAESDCSILGIKIYRPFTGLHKNMEYHEFVLPNMLCLHTFHHIKILSYGKILEILESAS